MRDEIQQQLQRKYSRPVLLLLACLTAFSCLLAIEKLVLPDSVNRIEHQEHFIVEITVWPNKIVRLNKAAIYSWSFVLLLVSLLGLWPRNTWGLVIAGLSVTVGLLLVILIQQAENQLTLEYVNRLVPPAPEERRYWLTYTMGLLLMGEILVFLKTMRKENIKIDKSKRT